MSLERLELGDQLKLKLVEEPEMMVESPKHRESFKLLRLNMGRAKIFIPIES